MDVIGSFQKWFIIEIWDENYQCRHTALIANLKEGLFEAHGLCAVN